jgi:hypothetical protein
VICNVPPADGLQSSPLTHSEAALVKMDIKASVKDIPVIREVEEARRLELTKQGVSSYSPFRFIQAIRIIVTSAEDQSAFECLVPLGYRCPDFLHYHPSARPGREKQ